MKPKEAKAKVNVTFQLSAEAAKKQIVNSGGDPNHTATLRDVIKSSRLSQDIEPCDQYNTLMYMQVSGYQIVRIDVA